MATNKIIRITGTMAAGFCLVSTLFAESELTINTDQCYKVLPVIRNDYRANANNKNRTNYKVILEEDTYTLKNEKDFNRKHLKIKYLGTREQFSVAHESLDLNTNRTKINYISACTVVFNKSRNDWDVIPIGKNRYNIITANDTTSRLSDEKRLYLEYSGVVESSYLVFAYDADTTLFGSDYPGFFSNRIANYAIADTFYGPKTYKYIIPSLVKTFNYKISDVKTFIKGFKVEIKKDKDNTTYTFSSDGDSTFVDEPNPNQLAIDNGVIPYFYVTTYKSWNDLNSYMWNNIDQRYSRGLEFVRQEIKAAKKYSQKDKLQPGDIFNYVKSSYRYVYAHSGNEDILPAELETILKNRSGDCKDLSFLLSSMLRYSGFKASFVLIRPQQMYNKDLDYPTLDFSHTIVKLTTDKKELFLETTDPYALYGSLDPGIRGRNYFEITPDGPVLGKTPEYSDGSEIIEREFVLDGSGNGIQKTHLRFYGYSYGSALPRYKMSRREIMDAVAKDTLFGSNHKFKKLEIKNAEGIEGPLDIYIETESSELITKTNDMLIAFKPLYFIRKDYTSGDNRKFPYLISNDLPEFTFQYKYVFPANYELGYMPQPFHYSSDFYEMSVKYEQTSPNTVICSQGLKYKKRIATPAEYAEEQNRLNNFYEYQTKNLVYRQKGQK